MATGQTRGVIHHLRRAVLLRDGSVMTDAQLLESFISRRDEAAMEALVRRHGPMVWGVCRRVLRDHQDAEDAFQTTFLVLVRKASSIASRELLANWLYGVAHLTASKARATTSRRRAKERPMDEAPEPASARPDPWHDLRPLLDDELSRLGDKYRAVVVLCDLEGNSRREAAGRLGLPEGTVASRLDRARAMLARRLARRGLAVPGVSLAAILSRGVASAGLPPTLVSTTIKAASLFAACPASAAGVVSPAVAALTERVVIGMSSGKLKALAAVLFAAGLLGSAGVVIGRSGADDPPPGVKAKAEAGHQKKQLEETILSLEKKVADAADKQDVETLRRYTADDFLGVADEGRYTRKDMLDGVAKFRFATLSMEDVRLVALNRDAVILSYKARFRRSSPEGKEAVLTTRYISSTWARRDGHWMYVFSDHTVIPDAGGAKPAAPGGLALPAPKPRTSILEERGMVGRVPVVPPKAAGAVDPLDEIEAASKILRSAGSDKEAKRRAAEALRKATWRLQERLWSRPSGNRP